MTRPDELRLDIARSHSLPDDASRERRDAAIANAARAYAEAVRARDELAAARGSLAVGDAAWFPGHRLGSREAIARYYDELAARAVNLGVWGRILSRQPRHEPGPASCACLRVDVRKWACTVRSEMNSRPAKRA